MTQKEIWIFLSHYYDDYDRVRCVRNMLEDFAIRSSMFFLKCLSEEKEIDNLIKREIDCRTRFILCDSPNARKSDWVQKEIEYIKTKGKGIEIIDVNDTDENIKKKLFSYQRKNHLYISYAREQRILAQQITQRLRKYDFNVFLDIDRVSFGMNFAEVIKEGIQQAIGHGKLIALLGTKSAQWTLKDLEYAIKLDVDKDSIIPIFLNEEAKRQFADMLKDFSSIDLSNIPNVTSLHIVNSLVPLLFEWGDILTYANNFRYGIGCKKDEEEADMLSSLYVSELEEKDVEFNGPGLELRLADIYGRGYGVKQDLNKAKAYLAEAHHCWGVDISAQLQELVKEQK